MKSLQLVDFVFDGPPGPESGRFVECEIDDAVLGKRSVVVGEWLRREDGYWVLRVHAVVNTNPDMTAPARDLTRHLRELPCLGGRPHGGHPWSSVGPDQFWCPGKLA